MPDPLLFPDAAPIPPGRVEPDDVAREYMRILPELSGVRLPLYPGIKKSVAAATRRERWSLFEWQDYFLSIRTMPWLMGQRSRWRADLTWLLGPKNMTKVLAGRYVDAGAPVPKLAQDIRERVANAYGLRSDAHQLGGGDAEHGDAGHERLGSPRGPEG